MSKPFVQLKRAHNSYDDIKIIRCRRYTHNKHVDQWPHYTVFTDRFNRFPFSYRPEPTSAGRLLICAASLSLAPDRTHNIRPVCTLPCDKDVLFLFCAPNTDVGYTPLMCTVITVSTFFAVVPNGDFP